MRFTRSIVLHSIALALVMSAMPAGRSFGVHSCKSLYGTWSVPSHLHSARSSVPGFGTCNEGRLQYETDGTPGGRSRGFLPKMTRAPMTCSPRQRQPMIGRIRVALTQDTQTRGLDTNLEGRSDSLDGFCVCTASANPCSGVLPRGMLASSCSAVVASPTSFSPLSMHTGKPCMQLLGPEAADLASKGREPKADVHRDGNVENGTPQKGNKGSGAGGQGGEGQGGQGGRGQGRSNGREGDDRGSGALAATSNSTNVVESYGDSHKLSSGTLDLESGVSVDQGLLRRSPLLRTTAPLWTFLRARAGLYGIMLGYVVFTLSQHISPVYVGMSVLTVLPPTPARKLLVLATQSLSVLTILSYIQDQFRHQVYPLPSITCGPSAPYAVITGGSSGIGREIANELAGRGYNILLVARGRAGLETAAKELEEASRVAAEAAQQESDGSWLDSSEPESRRKRKRRLRRERKGRMRRRSTSPGPSPSRPESPDASVSAPPASSIPSAASSSVSPSASPSASPSVFPSASPAVSSFASTTPPESTSEKEETHTRKDSVPRSSPKPADSPVPPKVSARSDHEHGSSQDQRQKHHLQPPQQQERQHQPRAEEGQIAEETTVAADVAKTISARWFLADLGNVSAAQAVHDEVQRLNLTVDVLVNAAGVCRVGRVEKCTDQDLEAQLMLNVVGTSRLTRLFAKDFAARRKGRILMVSSVVSAAPNPTVAAYAASKSYLTSFAEALHSELEVSGVGVTCVMPGATRTNFQDNSGSAQALVWQLPLFSMEADEVAARAVEALLRGDRTVVPGWQNKLYVHVLAPLLPRKIVMTFAEAMWR
ncbi:unnamed protein product [Scytosiphon promiscuus]